MNGDSGTPARPMPMRAMILSEPAAERPHAADDSRALSSETLLHALRRRWRLAVPLAAATAVTVGLVVSAQMPPMYVARTLVHVPATRPAILYGEADSRNDSFNFQRTQVAMVKSRFVLERAAAALATKNLDSVRAEPDPVERLAAQLTADFLVAPEIIQIKLRDANPGEMIVILDVVRDTYVREVLNKDRDEHDTRLKQLTDLAASHGTNLAKQRSLLAARAETLGAADPLVLRQQLEQGRVRVAALKGELNSVRATIRQVELAGERPTTPAPPDPDRVAEVVEQLLAADETAAAKRQEALVLEGRLADYRLHLRDFESSTTCRTLTTELAAARDALAGRRRELQDVAETRVKSAVARQQSQDHAARQQLGDAARAYLPQLESEVLGQEEATAKLARELGDLETVHKAIAQEEEQARLIGDRIRAMQVEQGAPPRARVLEPTAIAEAPAWRQYIKLAAAPLIAALGVVALFGWLDLRGGRVNGPADLEACRLNVLGAVPAVREQVLRMFGSPTARRSRAEFRRLSDALDIAREMILPHLPPSGGFVLAVTSAESGEGKTVLATHLAVRLARAGRRTLLVEADVRTPRLHTLFGIPTHPGLIALLRGEARLDDVTRLGPVPGLDVITSGGGGPDSLGNGLAGRIPELFGDLRARYDVVVVDTAPIRLASETLTLSRAADGVLLSVLRDVSRIREVLASYDRLASVDARILGVVFSGEPATRIVK